MCSFTNNVAVEDGDVVYTEAKTVYISTEKRFSLSFENCFLVVGMCLFQFFWWLDYARNFSLGNQFKLNGVDFTANTDKETIYTFLNTDFMQTPVFSLSSSSLSVNGTLILFNSQNATDVIMSTAHSSVDIGTQNEVYISHSIIYSIAEIK